MFSCPAGEKLQGMAHKFRYILSKEQASPCTRAKAVWMHSTLNHWLSNPAICTKILKALSQKEGCLFPGISTHSLAGARTSYRCSCECWLLYGPISSNGGHFRPLGISLLTWFLKSQGSFIVCWCLQLISSLIQAAFSKTEPDVLTPSSSFMQGPFPESLILWLPPEMTIYREVTNCCGLKCYFYTGITVWKCDQTEKKLIPEGKICLWPDH